MGNRAIFLWLLVIVTRTKSVNLAFARNIAESFSLAADLSDEAQRAKAEKPQVAFRALQPKTALRKGGAENRPFS